jgi:hypothetical protein
MTAMTTSPRATHARGATVPAAYRPGDVMRKDSHIA